MAPDRLSKRVHSDGAADEARGPRDGGPERLIEQGGAEGAVARQGDSSRVGVEMCPEPVVAVRPTPRLESLRAVNGAVHRSSERHDKLGDLVRNDNSRPSLGLSIGSGQCHVSARVPLLYPTHLLASST